MTTPKIDPETVATLLKRLSDTHLYQGYGEASDLPEEAADILEALTARVAELSEARDTMGNLWAKEAAERQVALGRADDAEDKLAEWMASQHYRYIGRDGKAVLARVLEDKLAEAEAAEEGAIMIIAAERAEVLALRRRLAAKGAETEKLRVALQTIVDSYEASSELHTSSADCAVNLYDHARAALQETEK